MSLTRHPEPPRLSCRVLLPPRNRPAGYRVHKDQLRVVVRRRWCGLHDYWRSCNHSPVVHVAGRAIDQVVLPRRIQVVRSEAKRNPEPVSVRFACQLRIPRCRFLRRYRACASARSPEPGRLPGSANRVIESGRQCCVNPLGLDQRGRRQAASRLKAWSNCPATEELSRLLRCRSHKPLPCSAQW